MLRKTLLLALCMSAVPSFLPAAQNQKTHHYTVIKDVKIFDGKSEHLLKDKELLIEDNKIVKIASHIDTNASVKIIDGKGETLIPGLIDAHTHLMILDDVDKAVYFDEPSYTGALAVEGAKRTLMRGFTTVRDAGGPVMGLKRAIDEGIVPGPRIFPSNAFISQTGGHGDFDLSMTYLSKHFTGIPDKATLYGWVYIADGVPEVQKAAREVLRSGASQIKVMGSGSVTGAHDPIEVAEYTYDELKAIVDEAKKWGTYVMIHAYSDEGVRTAIKAGVVSIEHGLMMKPETFKLMKEKGVWFSTQYALFSKDLDDFPQMKGTPAGAKFLEVKKYAKRAYELASKYKVKMSWGTDAFGSLQLQAAESEEFLARAKYFSAVEILRQATSYNAQLLALSGKRSPYRDGKLGVIAKGAYADLLIVDGDPTKDITLLAHPDKSLKLIMKDGIVYKNTLPN